MSTANRITLAALLETPLEAVAALPADQLALLQAESNEATAHVKRLREHLDTALDFRYRARADEQRRANAKDTGTARLDEGEFIVVADLPKRVRWAQDQLATIAERIRASGEDPAEYLSIELSVSERAYAAWPSAIRAAFEPARTVETGKPTYRFEQKGDR
jgi:hypothetical protein